MRYVLISTIFIAGMANTAIAEYVEVRELTLDTRGIDTLNIDSGDGSLDVVGVPGSGRITVTAKIRVPGGEDKARRKIEREMRLSLERDTQSADLDAKFARGIWAWGRRPVIQLEVRMPEALHLTVRDGTGPIRVENVRGNLCVSDGTGSMTLNEVGGNVRVRDGTGSIRITSVGGDISVKDGTGGIRIRRVKGNVTVNDGAGGIDIADVENDLVIVDAGTGGLRLSNIGGNIHR